MHESVPMSVNRLVDVAIVGGGLCGLAFLVFVALKCLCLSRAA